MADIRIGIDVGGTFTHAVALEAVSGNLVASVCRPTTHSAAEGVARGILESLEKLLSESHLDVSNVQFIAHSTTQATNALLEGDVATVGIVSLGQGMEGGRVQSQTRLGDVPLGGGRKIPTLHRFVDTTQPPTLDQLRAVVKELKNEGAQVIVAAAAFSVDDPSYENAVTAAARLEGLPSCATHEISGLYGLRIRTRTAVINGSILPKMLEVAQMTGQAVAKLGITAPLMVMRSDGGVMSLEEMKQRPLLTILSGPAAGVAAALQFVKISTGIWVEVGGTSTDLCGIKDGRALIRSAEVGGHQLHLKTLDVRTIGIAGGSLPLLRHKRFVTVGPRSAHIAGLSYASFASPEEIQEAAAGVTADGYLMLKAPKGGGGVAVTPTCAANFLGNIPAGDHAYASSTHIHAALDKAGHFIGLTGEQLANAILTKAVILVSAIISRLLKDYRLVRTDAPIVLGGGGASVYAKGLGRIFKREVILSPHAPVISAIGAATALLHETVEHHRVNPTPNDLLEIRSEVLSKIVKMGADVKTVDVRIEVDAPRQIIRASAMGSLPMKGQGTEKSGASAHRLDDLKRRFVVQGITITEEKSSEWFTRLAVSSKKSRWGGLLRRDVSEMIIVDHDGVVSWRRSRAIERLSSIREMPTAVREIAESLSQYGDAGRVLPEMALIVNHRLVNLSGMIAIDQVVALAAAECDGLPADHEVVLLGAPRSVDF